MAGDAAGGDDAGHEIGPVFNVLFGIGAHRGLARGTGGGVDAHDVLHGHGQHAKGVVIPDVVLGGEGDVLDVRQGFYFIPAGDAYLAQALVVERDVVVAVVHHPLQAPQLQGFNIRPLHGFYVFLGILYRKRRGFASVFTQRRTGAAFFWGKGTVPEGMPYSGMTPIFLREGVWQAANAARF